MNNNRVININELKGNLDKTFLDIHFSEVQLKDPMDQETYFMSNNMLNDKLNVPETYDEFFYLAEESKTFQIAVLDNDQIMRILYQEDTSRNISLEYVQNPFNNSIKEIPISQLGNENLSEIVSGIRFGKEQENDDCAIYAASMKSLEAKY